MGEYLLDNAQPEAGERFTAFEELFDPWSRAHLLRAGVRPGARVWEVGAGSPALPRWLAAQVGPRGRVVATDIDVGRLSTGEGYEVLRHDVAGEPAPGGPFDVVHARLVLVHLPGREAALASMVAALAPGATLLVEDADPALQPLACPDERGPAEALANRLRRGFRGLLSDSGADLAFGRTLPRLLRAAGLADVAAEGYVPVAGAACAALEDATIRQVTPRLLAAGLATDADVRAHLANVASGQLDLTTAPLISAWGRLPTGT